MDSTYPIWMWCINISLIQTRLTKIREFIVFQVWIVYCRGGGCVCVHMIKRKVSEIRTLLFGIKAQYWQISPLLSSFLAPPPPTLFFSLLLLSPCPASYTRTFVWVCRLFPSGRNYWATVKARFTFSQISKLGRKRTSLPKFVHQSQVRSLISLPEQVTCTLWTRQ